MFQHLNVKTRNKKLRIVTLNSPLPYKSQEYDMHAAVANIMKHLSLNDKDKAELEVKNNELNKPSLYRLSGINDDPTSLA